MSGLHVGGVEQGNNGLPQDGERHAAHQSVVEDVAHGDGTQVLTAPHHQPAQDTCHQGDGIDDRCRPRAARLLLGQLVQDAAGEPGVLSRVMRTLLEHLRQFLVFFVGIHILVTFYWSINCFILPLARKMRDFTEPSGICMILATCLRGWSSI